MQCGTRGSTIDQAERPQRPRANPAREQRTTWPSFSKQSGSNINSSRGVMDVCATLMGFMLRAFGQSVPVNGTFLFLQDDWRSTCCSFVAMYVDCAHKWKVAPTEWEVYGSVPFLHFLQHWRSVRTKVQPRYHPEVRSWEGGLGGNFPHQ